MKIITEEKLYSIIKKKWKSELVFKQWWYKQREKHLSQGYGNKDIMKLPIDTHTILPYLLKSLKLENVKVVETDEYPTPGLSVEHYIRDYKLIYN